MLSDAFFEGSLYSARIQAGIPTGFITPLTLTWMVGILLSGASTAVLQGAHMTFYVIHELIFFTFLNFLPLGKHFHVITSFFVDDGMVPQSLQKPLNSLVKRSNPYGKMEKKRADWTISLEKDQGIPVKLLGQDKAQTLYFVDSVTSYDDRNQEIGKSMARILSRIGVDFGILTAGTRSGGLVKKCSFLR